MLRKILGVILILFIITNIEAKDFENKYYKCTVSSIGNGVTKIDVPTQKAKEMNQYELSLRINEKTLKIGNRSTYNFIRK